MSKLGDILCRPRICAADWLVIQARDLAAFAQETTNPTLLVFSCLEARNAIEQLWSELLIVIYGGSVDRKFFEKCRRRRDGFLAAIKEAAPRYRQLSRFTAICLQLDSQAPCDGIAWDLDRLKRLWHSLSSYCHAQAHPAATLNCQEWFSRGLALVHEVFAYFEQEMSRGATAVLPPENMTPEARMIWEEFADGRITDDQARIRLRLVQPLQCE